MSHRQLCAIVPPILPVWPIRFYANIDVMYHPRRDTGGEFDKEDQDHAELHRVMDLFDAQTRWDRDVSKGVNGFFSSGSRLESFLEPWVQFYIKSKEPIDAATPKAERVLEEAVQTIGRYIAEGVSIKTAILNDQGALGISFFRGQPFVPHTMLCFDDASSAFCTCLYRLGVSPKHREREHSLSQISAYMRLKVDSEMVVMRMCSILFRKVVLDPCESDVAAMRTMSKSYSTNTKSWAQFEKAIADRERKKTDCYRRMRTAAWNLSGQRRGSRIDEEDEEDETLSDVAVQKKAVRVQRTFRKVCMAFAELESVLRGLDCVLVARPSIERVRYMFPTKKEVEDARIAFSMPFDNEGGLFMRSIRERLLRMLRVERELRDKVTRGGRVGDVSVSIFSAGRHDEELVRSVLSERVRERILREKKDERPPSTNGARDNSHQSLLELPEITYDSLKKEAKRKNLQSHEGLKELFKYTEHMESKLKGADEIRRERMEQRRIARMERACEQVVGERRTSEGMEFEEEFEELRKCLCTVFGLQTAMKVSNVIRNRTRENKMHPWSINSMIPALYARNREDTYEQLYDLGLRHNVDMQLKRHAPSTRRKDVKFSDMMGPHEAKRVLYQVLRVDSEEERRAEMEYVQSTMVSGEATSVPLTEETLRMAEEGRLDELKPLAEQADLIKETRGSRGHMEEEEEDDNSQSEPDSEDNVTMTTVFSGSTNDTCNTESSTRTDQSGESVYSIRSRRKVARMRKYSRRKKTAEKVSTLRNVAYRSVLHRKGKEHARNIDDVLERLRARKPDGYDELEASLRGNQDLIKEAEEDIYAFSKATRVDRDLLPDEREDVNHALTLCAVASTDWNKEGRYDEREMPSIMVYLCRALRSVDPGLESALENPVRPVHDTPAALAKLRASGRSPDLIERINTIFSLVPTHESIDKGVYSPVSGPNTTTVIGDLMTPYMDFPQFIQDTQRIIYVSCDNWARALGAFEDNGGDENLPRDAKQWLKALASPGESTGQDIVPPVVAKPTHEDFLRKNAELSMCTVGFALCAFVRRAYPRARDLRQLQVFELLMEIVRRSKKGGSRACKDWEQRHKVVMRQAPEIVQCLTRYARAMISLAHSGQMERWIPFKEEKPFFPCNRDTPSEWTVAKSGSMLVDRMARCFRMMGTIHVKESKGKQSIQRKSMIVRVINVPRVRRGEKYTEVQFQPDFPRTYLCETIRVYTAVGFEDASSWTKTHLDASPGFIAKTSELESARRAMLLYAMTHDIGNKGTSISSSQKSGMLHKHSEWDRARGVIPVKDELFTPIGLMASALVSGDNRLCYVAGLCLGRIMCHPPRGLYMWTFESSSVPSPDRVDSRIGYVLRHLPVLLGMFDEEELVSCFVNPVESEARASSPSNPSTRKRGRLSRAKKDQRALQSTPAFSIYSAASAFLAQMTDLYITRSTGNEVLNWMDNRLLRPLTQKISSMKKLYDMIDSCVRNGSTTKSCKLVALSEAPVGTTGGMMLYLYIVLSLDQVERDHSVSEDQRQSVNKLMKHLFLRVHFGEDIKPARSLRVANWNTSFEDADVLYPSTHLNKEHAGRVSVEASAVAQDRRIEGAAAPSVESVSAMVRRPYRDHELQNLATFCRGMFGMKEVIRRSHMLWGNTSSAEGGEKKKDSDQEGPGYSGHKRTLTDTERRKRDFLKAWKEVDKNGRIHYAELIRSGVDIPIGLSEKMPLFVGNVMVALSSGYSTHTHKRVVQPETRHGSLNAPDPSLSNAFTVSSTLYENLLVATEKNVADPKKLLHMVCDTQ